MKSIIVTGANGFIGTQAVLSFSRVFERTVGIDKYGHGQNSMFFDLDLTDANAVVKSMDTLKPDVIVHCAGIAHQKVGKISRNDYFKVNSLATEQLAKAAVSANPDVHFIFLSSVCVYGEDHGSTLISENSLCNPSSDYAESKLDAEFRIEALFNKGTIKRIDILRLSPVYDSTWSMNLNRRVLAPGKKAYLRFGNGEQKISAISRQNLIDFIEFIILNREMFGERYCNIYNVCDEQPYSFNDIIEIFKLRKSYPGEFVVPVPLLSVWVLTRMAGCVFKEKQKWIHSCYDKLACDLVFNNERMLNTGFRPKHTLKSVFMEEQS